MDLVPHGSGTRLSYDFTEAEVSGKVAAVGGRMLEGAAKVVLRQLFESLGRQACRQADTAARLACPPAGPRREFVDEAIRIRLPARRNHAARARCAGPWRRGRARAGWP
ncbi:hypothetical protein ACTMU2_19910 [Cupriavidus basilensis]